MEIRMAYPNEINRIMEIIQDGKDSLAAAGVDQWQDGYPDQEIIFEDILESRGYVAVENQEVVAYAALYKGNEAAYNDIYDGKWEHDNYLAQIPYGESRTYGEIARALSCRSAQAIGQAVGRNPLLLLIPCHRVLGTEKKLTGYAAGLDRKRWLLQHEAISWKE